MDARPATEPIILVIDADAAFTAAVRNSFTAQGYRVEICMDAKSGLESVPRLKPDVVISEMLLPGRSCFRVVEQMKKQDPTLPIIMAASFGSLAQRSLAELLGVDEFLPKPVSTNRLLESVRRYCTPGLNPPHTLPTALRLSDVQRGT